ncbi:MAG: hypothetical protein JSV31_29430 [Desulfobacterales bacterium]|nr:MAG: hypothetical protein JSV31_29430 [Desulfobacterales bacterium]
MAKEKKPMKGVFQKNGYWYASINGQQIYADRGSKGFEIAKAAKEKDNVKKYEQREISTGLKVKRYDLKTFKAMCNWYMTRPSIQNQKSYKRKISIAAHLLKFFGGRSVGNVSADHIEDYRESRLNEGAVNTTIDLEVGTMRAMYNMACKRKKIPPDFMPGEFLQVKEKKSTQARLRCRISKAFETCR